MPPNRISPNVGSLDIVVIPVVLVFPEFLIRFCAAAVESQFSLQKWTFFSPHFFWGGGDFHGVPSSTNNTAKTSVGEDVVKIRPAIAEQSCQRKHRTATKI